MIGDDCPCPQCVERRRLHSAPELEAGKPFVSPTDARRAEKRNAERETSRGPR